MPRVTPASGSEGGPYLGVLERRPEILRLWSELSTGLRFEGLLPATLKESVRRSTASRVGCAYCASVGGPPADVDARTSLAIAVAAQIVEDPRELDDSMFDVLREEFTDDEIVELIAFVSFVCVGGQTFGAAMAVEPMDERARIAYEERLRGMGALGASS